MRDLDVFLARTNLIDRLAGNGHPGLIVLAAPAGYGKTWLGGQVAQRWGASAGAPAPTWRLQRGSTVRSALRLLCELFGLKAGCEGDDADDVLARLRRRGARLDALIVDVDGAPPSKAVQALIARVVQGLAPGRRTLVSCRNARLLPVDRLPVLLPSMQVFGARELEIDPEEPGSPSRPGSWWQLTQGWPLLCTQPAEADLEQMVGGVGPYLEHELLAPLASADVELLMQVSVVDAVEPGMPEALELGATWSRVAALVECGLPLSNTQGDWDRVVLHPVLRRFLQRRLLAHAPAAHRVLHRRAARWFAAAQRFVEAMRHAQQAGDPALEAQITERSGGWRLSWREGLQALSPASAVTGPEVAARFPRAALARIYWQAQTGRIEEARQALERLEAQASAPQIANDLLSVRAVIAIYRDEEVDEDLVRQLGEMRQDPADEEPLLLPGGATLQAALLNNAGHYDRAAQAARAAILEAEAQGSRYVAYYGQLQHGLALLGQGRCDDALAPLDQAQGLATALFGAASGEGRTVGLLSAHAAWLAGRNDEAERRAAELADLYRLHAWLEPYARILQVAMAVARDRGGRGLEARVIEDIEDLAVRRGLVRLRSLVALARARRMTGEGRIEQADAACDAVIASMSALRPGFSARVLAAAWLEKSRGALARSAFEEAGQAMCQFERWNAALSDGVLATEGDLIASYLAVRERRHREAAQRFTRCVLDAQRTGLRRPFIDHAAWVDEWVRHARTHAIPVAPEHLELATRYADTGRPAARPSAAAPRLAGALRAGLLLTQRETDILQCLSQGLSSKEMARQLSITEATVKTHRKHLYEKLGVALRSQAIVKARELGVL